MIVKYHLCCCYNQEPESKRPFTKRREVKERKYSEKKVHQVISIVVGQYSNLQDKAREYRRCIGENSS